MWKGIGTWNQGGLMVEEDGGQRLRNADERRKQQ